MNLETKLTECLNDVLRSSGYMFEIINKNKRQSNFITGTNNQLIPPIITAQLGSSISKFDDLLDETMGKFDDARWCIESIVESKQKQVEMKKEEEEKQKRLKQEELRKEELRKEELKKEELKKEELRKEEELKKQQELAKQKKLKEQEDLQKEHSNNEDSKPTEPADKKDDFDFMQFDFMNDVSSNIPNPSDILSSIDYDLDLNGEKVDINSNTNNSNSNNHTNKNINNSNSNNKTNGTNNTNDNNDNSANAKQNNANNSNNDEKTNIDDLDINNILGNNDSILDGLNMSLLDEQPQTNNLEEDFDVDNFLNQFKEF